MPWIFNKRTQDGREEAQMFDMQRIGAFIAMCRKERGLTQNELAQHMGVSFQAVSNWERGTAMPDISKLEPLSNLLQITPEELLSGRRMEPVQGEHDADPVAANVQPEDQAAQSQQKTECENAQPKPTDEAGEPEVQADNEIDLEQLYQQLPGALLPWYQKNARRLPWRADRQPYHVWVSEIMLQQTRVEAVKGYYERFLQAFPTIAALAQAPEQRLLKCWEGLGYYNRARNLQKTARIVIDQYDGVFPQNYEQIIRLPGIGPYTAGAIASICFDQPKAAVDGNVLRVISRICAIHEPVDKPKIKQQITQRLEAVYPRQAGMFTQSLMELGALICTPDGQPKCGDCPAADFCRAKQLGIQTQLPKRMPKQPRRVEKLTVFILCCGGQLAICRREKHGLLAGLWQLPNLSGTQTDQQAIDTVRQWGLQPETLRKSIRRRHVFTHVEWEMIGFYIDCAVQTEQFVWADAQQLEQAYPLPTAFRLFLESS